MTQGRKAAFITTSGTLAAAIDKFNPTLAQTTSLFKSL